MLTPSFSFRLGNTACKGLAVDVASRGVDLVLGRFAENKFILGNTRLGDLEERGLREGGAGLVEQAVTGGVLLGTLCARIYQGSDIAAEGERLTVVELEVVPVNHAADLLMDLEVASSTPFLRREPWSKSCRDKAV